MKNNIDLVSSPLLCIFNNRKTCSTRQKLKGTKYRVSQEKVTLIGNGLNDLNSLNRTWLKSSIEIDIQTFIFSYNVIEAIEATEAAEAMEAVKLEATDAADISDATEVTVSTVLVPTNLPRPLRSLRLLRSLRPQRSLILLGSLKGQRYHQCC